MRDMALEREMELTQAVVNAGHSLRKEYQLKVRQPLARAHLVAGDKQVIEALKDQEDLIKEELNVKMLTFYIDESQFVSLRPKPNFRVLGKKVGKKMEQVKKEIERLDQSMLQRIFDKEPIEIAVEGEVISLTEEDVLIERQVHDGLVASCVQGITIALDTHLTPELIREGIAREIVNRVNTLRKSQGFEVTDRVSLSMDADAEVIEAFEEHMDYITHEVLATEVRFEKLSGGEEVEIHEHPTKLVLRLS
jgi:isoleucyl-tRNA synthetase